MGQEQRSKRAAGVRNNVPFLFLWSGLMVSSVGDWINYIAMAALVYGRTHSVVMLTLLRICHIVPILLIAPLAGVYVDRWSRQATLVFAPLAAGIAAMGLVVYQAIWFVFVVYGAITIALTFFNPARAAIVPDIVEPAELVQANSLLQITSTSSIVVGGVLGGVLVSSVGYSAAFLINGITFLFVALAARLLRPRASRHQRMRQSIGFDMREGLAYLWKQPLVGVVVGSGALFVLAEATVLTLGIAYVRTQLHGDATLYGEMLGGLGLGSVAGAITVARYRQRVSLDLTFTLSGTIAGAGVFVLGQSRLAVLAACAYGVAGFGTMISTVSAVTLLQRIVPDHVRGRIFALASTLDHVAAFASTLAIGIATSALSPGNIISGSGILAMGAGLVSVIVVLKFKSGLHASPEVPA